MNFCSESLVSEDFLESYAMGKLPGADRVALEAHLLVCTICRTRVAAIEDFVLVIRTALAELELRPTARISPQLALSL
jgi:anti-sigma factor RsiW